MNFVSLSDSLSAFFSHLLLSNSNSSCLLARTCCSFSTLSNISFAAFSALSTLVIFLRFFLGGPSTPGVGVAVRLPDGVGVAVRLPDGVGVAVRLPDGVGVAVRLPDNVSAVWLLDVVLVSNGALSSL